MRPWVFALIVLLAACHRRTVYLHLDADQAPHDTVWRTALLQTDRELLGGRRFDATALACGAGEELRVVKLCEGRAKVCAVQALGPDGARRPTEGTVAGLRVLYACGPARAPMPEPSADGGDASPPDAP